MSSADATYPVWDGKGWIVMPVAEMLGEALVVPNIAALVFDGVDRERVLLQRRDKPGEAVRGRWELPGGRWRAGEPPEQALRREVLEETGLEVTSILGPVERREVAPNVAFGVVRPLAVVNGIGGAYPSLHVVVACVATGTPRALGGETADPTWWRVEALRDALQETPDQFVWHTAVMLGVAFED